MPYTHERCLEHIQNHSHWHLSKFPIAEDKYEPFLESGFLYVHKRDRQYRPILVLNLERAVHIGQKTSVNDMMYLVYAMLEFTTDKLMMPGRVEQFSIIIDLHNASLLEKLPV